MVDTSQLGQATTENRTVVRTRSRLSLLHLLFTRTRPPPSTLPSTRTARMDRLNNY